MKYLFSDKMYSFQVSGFGRQEGEKESSQIKLYELKSEPQNIEYRIMNFEGRIRFARSF